MSEQIHGQATIRLDGQVYETEDDATIVPGGRKNNDGRMIGQKFNYSQTVIPSQVTCKVPLTNGVSMTDLQGLTNVEIIFESDMGKSWVIRGAVQQGELSLQGGDSGGTVEMIFSGPPAEEVS